MNYPSRVDPVALRPGHNNSPPALAADTTTRKDLNSVENQEGRTPSGRRVDQVDANDGGGPGDGLGGDGKVPLLPKIRGMLSKYARFIGPGFMISVSYMDPGNYSTDVAAGATFKYSHLFVILMANIFAIFLQSLCIRLGIVTGMDLAMNCRENLPRWLNYLLYVLAECAIIATDIAEVIGTAIALNILLKIPLVAGVAITMVDVMVVLYFYRPNGQLRGLRFFEAFVTCLVFGVIICFCIELSKIEDADVGEIFRGFLPSKDVARGNGLYLSCGILGATVMPHSLYLGSGIVQARVRDFDIKSGYYTPPSTSPASSTDSLDKYRPSLRAINYSIWMSIADLAISLFTCALFANSAILIVAGAALHDTPEARDADLFGIYDLLTANVGKGAGIVFALALLFSGESSGVVVTLAGQMVSEGFLRWSVKPWMRRLVTRTIAIAPCIAVAAGVGRSGLGGVLNASQVALSILLPFVTAPLVWFTCRGRYMKIGVDRCEGATGDRNEDRNYGSTAVDGGASVENGLDETMVDFKNNWFWTAAAIAIWGFIAFLNVYLVISLGLGYDS